MTSVLLAGGSFAHAAPWCRLQQTIVNRSSKVWTVALKGYNHNCGWELGVAEQLSFPGTGETIVELKPNVRKRINPGQMVRLYGRRSETAVDQDEIASLNVMDWDERTYHSFDVALRLDGPRPVGSFQAGIHPENCLHAHTRQTLTVQEMTLEDVAPGGAAEAPAGDLAALSANGGDRVKIHYFGAACDGVTDDTAAIQRAFNAAHRSRNLKTVHIPHNAKYAKRDLVYHEDVLVWDESRLGYPSLVLGHPDGEFRLESPNMPGAATNAPYLALINRRESEDRSCGIVARWGQDESHPRNTWQMCFGRDDKTQGFQPDYVLFSWPDRLQVARETVGWQGGFLFNPDNTYFDPLKTAQAGTQFVFNTRKEAPETEAMGVLLRSRNASPVNLDLQGGGPEYISRFTRKYRDGSLRLFGAAHTQELMSWADSGLVTVEGDLLVKGRILSAATSAPPARAIYSSVEDRSVSTASGHDLITPVVLPAGDLTAGSTYCARTSGRLSAPKGSTVKATLCLGPHVVMESAPFQMDHDLWEDYFALDATFTVRSGGSAGKAVGTGKLELVARGRNAAYAMTSNGEAELDASIDQPLSLQLKVVPAKPEGVLASLGASGFARMDNGAGSPVHPKATAVIATVERIK